MKTSAAPTQRAIENAVIRDSNGKLRVWQCRPKLKTEYAISRSTKEFDNLTVADILNKRKQRQQLLNSILNH